MAQKRRTERQKLLWLAPAALMALAALQGCETVEGMGEDLQTAGQAVEQEAQEAQTP